MDIQQVAGVLGRVHLFQKLPPSELQRLASVLRMDTEPDGKLLFREGDPGDTFYIVVDGAIEIIKALDAPGERLMAILGPGECIGEMSLVFPEGTRSASVRALGPARLLQMSKPDFEALLERQPRLAFEMMRVMSERIKANEADTVRDLTEKNTQLQQAFEQLQAAQAELVEKEKLERELQLARQIQMSVLPDPLPHSPAFEFGAFIEPARAVGGDFYDVISLSGGRLGLVIGDVTDKGMPAAIFMAQTYALVHSEASRGAAPGRVLRRVNQMLLETNASSLFATVLYGILDPQERTFTYARAGHELPLVQLPNGETLMAPKNLGQPIGILDAPSLDENILRLPPGSTLLLFTDGVTDESSPQEERFGTRRLVDVIKKSTGLKASEICQTIYRALVEHKSGAAQFDDITLLAARSL